MQPPTSLADTSSQDALAELWYSTGDPYYQDVYTKAYGHSLGARLPVESDPAAIPEAPLVPASVQSPIRLNDPSPFLPQNTSRSSSDDTARSFFELPAELRILIYQFAFRSSTSITGTTKVPAIGLLATCRQAHEEASSILYGENTFTFTASIDFQHLPEIFLTEYPDTRKLGIWPAKTYHPDLRALHIRFNFNGGEDQSLTPPPVYVEQIQAMRKAFDETWHNLNLTVEFLRLPEYSFTTFWLKFLLFEPLYHRNCTIILPKQCKNPEITQFLLEYVLSNRNHRAELTQKQTDALDEATSLTRFTLQVHIYGICSDLANRMCYCDPNYRSHPWLPNNTGPTARDLVLGGPEMHPKPQQPTQVQPAAGGIGMGLLPGLFAVGANTQLQTKSRADLVNHLQIIFGFRNPNTVDWLLKDTELRILAAMKYPAQSKALILRDDIPLRIYTGMLNLATKWTAEEQSANAHGH